MTREEAKEFLINISYYLGTTGIEYLSVKHGKKMHKAIKALEQEPKIGHWINVNEGKWNTIPAYKCSECGANADLRDWSGKSPFCPWCGAKMVELQERSGEE